MNQLLINNQLPEIHCTLKYIMYDTLKYNLQTLHSQRQVSLNFHHLVRCYRPKKLKIERRRKANCERDNAPIFTIRVLRAILILLRLLARNFTFGAEAIISARAKVRHAISTKFQPGKPG